MAKTKKDMYNGLNLFDFMDQVAENIESNIQVLEQNIISADDKGKENDKGRIQQLTGREEEDIQNALGRSGTGSERGRYALGDISSDGQSGEQEVDNRDDRGTRDAALRSLHERGELVDADSELLVQDVSGAGEGSGWARVAVGSNRPDRVGVADIDGQESSEYDAKRNGLDGHIRDVQHRQDHSSQADIEQRTSLRRPIHRREGTHALLDYSARDDDFISGNTDKYNKNIAAIKLLKRLTSENRTPTTKEEQVTLASFSGWGKLPQVFDENNLQWEAEYKELKSLLGKKEYEEARSSTQNSFYTPKLLVDAIYKSLDKLGINESGEEKSVLEPSVGLGGFIAFSENRVKNAKYTGVEIDKTTHSLSKLLYPKQDIENKPFQDIQLVSKYDVVIGNPPFGDTKIYDAEHPDLNGLSIHNYFLAKSIKMLKPDGIAAFVVSSYFMDGKDDRARELISKEATFLGAVRLPNTAFKNAGTKAVTDIVFFKKGHDIYLHKNFANVNEHFFYSSPEALWVNEYWNYHRENILGNMKWEITNIGKTQQCVPNGTDIQLSLDKFVEKLPENIYKYHEYKQEPGEFIADKSQEKEIFGNNYINKNNLFIYNDNICQRLDDGKSDSISYKVLSVKAATKERIKDMIALRNQMKALYALEKQDIENDDTRLTEARQKLNTLYDKFRQKHGYLHETANKNAFKQDRDGNKLLGLERNYSAKITEEAAKKHGVTPQSSEAEKSDVFYKRVIGATKTYTASTPEEALVVSLNVHGCVKKEYMAEILPQYTQEKIIEELIEKELIFNDHTQSDNYIIAAQYLSGNVKQKLKEVKALNDGSLALNLQALEKVQPKDVEAANIAVNIGATWIPTKYYNKFLTEALKIQSYVDYNEKIGEWSIKEMPLWSIPADVKSKFSSQRMGIDKIVKHVLEHSPIAIYDTIKDENGKEKRTLNAQETAIANQKAEALSQAFDDWIWNNYERRVDLCRIYNDTFNTHVAPKYDGSNLELQNFNDDNVTLRKHQRDAIQRSKFERNVLLDHEVGAGKTYEAICSVMERKRIGVTDKPLIVVPNHLLEQWKSDFQKIYPDADILVADKKDLQKDNREEFFGKIAANNYDAVIMTHSQFSKISAPYETVVKKIEEDLQILDEIIAERRKEGVKIGIKDQEKRRDKLKERLKKLINEKTKSKAMDFSDLGIDMLVVDEAHEFKNLSILTKMQVNGLGNVGGSQKAYNTYCITEYLNENKKGIMFLSGTPIANSISEVYNIQRYLQPETLKEKGINRFDSWALLFGEVSQSYELDSSGVNYKLVSRFSKFKNVPELLNYYHSVADVVTNSDIEKYTQNYIPKTYGGKPINIAVERSPEVANFIGVQDDNGAWNKDSIVYRMEHSREDPVRNNVLACTTDARKAGLDYRLIDPNAEDNKETKINSLVDNVCNIFNETANESATQLIFCDLSTPKSHSQNIVIDEALIKEELTEKADEIDRAEDGSELSMLSEDELIAKGVKFDVYNDVINKLEAKGVPREQVRFIHDAKTDLQKAQLFQDIRDGKVRVLMGSTQKMGAGMNVQDKLVAIHHLDCPWRPADLKQRNGRIYRQGNKFFEKDPSFTVKEFRYSTKQTYDARMWQVIETKAKAIEQFRHGVNGARVVEDISMDSANAAEMKAIATGNPLILEQVKISNELKKTEIEYQSFLKETHQKEDSIKHLTNLKPYREKIIKELEEAIKTRDEHTIQGAPFTVELKKENRVLTIHKDDDSQENKQAQEQLNMYIMDAVTRLFLHNGKDKSREMFNYRGFNVSVCGIGQKGARFSIEKNDFMFDADNLLFDNRYEITSRGLFTRLNNTINGFENAIAKEKNKMQKEEKELNQLKSIPDKVFPKLELLHNLREDNVKIIEEIKNSRKSGYKQEWKPRSQTER